MSTAIAMAPSPAPHDRTAFGADLPPAPATASPAHAAQHSPSAQRSAVLPPPPPPLSAAPSHAQHRSGSGSPRGGANSASAAASKSSPPSASRHSGPTPKIIVKKEPSSPDLPGTRHRPRKLDLSKNTITGTSNLATARPLTARESGGLGIQEVGLACLSPGFVTQDPVMKEQLQRSLNVREQQRQIIEQRMQQQSAKGDGPDHSKDKDGAGHFTAKTPGLARKRGAPPGLSIVAPSHEHFANERVIQSAPLGQTFTGRHNPHPLTRHIANQPSSLASSSHIHHVPANQTNNRLPPISDVFGQVSGHPESSGHTLFAQQAAARGPLASPGHPPLTSAHQAPTPGRPREYKSAEEAQAELAGGRPELLPKLVHYGGHQPPTSPSPQPLNHATAGAPSSYSSAAAAAAASQQRQYTDASRSASSKRRTRAEYEEGGSPPLGNGRAPIRRSGPFGEGRDSPETQRAKKEEFIRLCERAWDLFHS